MSTKAYNYRCAKCHRMRDREGSGLRLILGVQSRICAVCLKNSKAMPKTKPKPQFVIGVGGKHVRVPQGQQAKFTSAHNIKALPVGVATGFDPRYQVNPDTFKGDHFSALPPGQYPDEAQSCAARAK